MRKALFYVWDHILILACLVAFATSFTIGCASKPAQTEIAVGPVSCKSVGTMISCTGPENALWTLGGTYAAFGERFSYYSPQDWTRLEVTVLGWGTQIWVHRYNGQVEYSLRGPK
jgi:hypothetical protein